MSELRSSLFELRSKCCGARVGQKGWFYPDWSFEPRLKLPDPIYYCQECNKPTKVEETAGKLNLDKG